MEPRKTITDFRLDRDLTQVELAQKAGISPTTVIQAELGRPIFKSTLNRICTVLEVRPDDVADVVFTRRKRLIRRRRVTKD